MRPVDEVEIGPGERIELRPGGMHLMLMQPARRVMLGDLVVIELVDADGVPMPATFKVSSMPPSAAANADDHAGHEH